MESWEAKYALASFIVATIVMSTIILVCNGRHDLAVFLAQSIIDNAIFCGMFIAIVVITGIRC